MSRPLSQNGRWEQASVTLPRADSEESPFHMLHPETKLQLTVGPSLQPVKVEVKHSANPPVGNESQPAIPRASVFPPAGERMSSPQFQPAPQRHGVEQKNQRPVAVVRSDALSEPAIQVTIGRIEIRATQQVPSAPRAKSMAPRLSLEDYLKVRHGGTR
ncbi:MAG: hypothetical protein LAO78_13285 [Acidobacteriia bacterium]|nr:hypothetical protein [Terriglobia bacterium]